MEQARDPHSLGATMVQIYPSKSFIPCGVEKIASEQIQFGFIRGLLFLSGTGVCLGLMISIAERGKLYAMSAKLLAGQIGAEVSKAASTEVATKVSRRAGRMSRGGSSSSTPPPQRVVMVWDPADGAPSTADAGRVAAVDQVPTAAVSQRSIALEPAEGASAAGVSEVSQRPIAGSEIPVKFAPSSPSRALHHGSSIACTTTRFEMDAA